MGVTKPYQVKTRNGELIEANLYDSLSILRTPEKREEILQGRFHKVAVPDGTKEITIEKPFLYTDLSRNEVILVKPLSERYTWRATSSELEQIVKHLPNTVSPPETRFMRVVFGLGELREKLLAREAGIDDRALELFKVLLAYEHPIILQQPRLNINLHTIDSKWLTFIASYEHDKTAYQLRMPRILADNLLAQPDELKQWVASSHKENLFELEQNHDHWVNFRRWSPTETALNLLSDFAQKARQNQDIDANSTDFQTMLQGLPSGNHMPSWAKQALRDLFVWAKDGGNGQLQDKLFEVRFNKKLDDDWYLNDDPDDIDTLWKLLQNLPDTNVEGNTRFDVIDLEDGGGAFYSPGDDQIVIGRGFFPSFEDVMLHEVGHAVQEKLDQAKKDLVTNQLKEQFGWQTFGLDDSEIDAWVKLMGGYGNITDLQKQEIRKYLRDSIGFGGQWEPPQQAPNVPSGHPWYATNFGPRLACEQTGAYWYDKNQKWYRANGLAFFLNYYYQTFTVVNESTLDLVERMPSSYAAMSPFEFFAELYAVFYNLNYSDWGNIPQNLRDWLWDNIGSPMPIAGKYYMLRNKQSRQVLDVFSFRQENGADVIQWPGSDNENQQWLLEDMGNGYYTLTVKHSGKALAVRDASTQDGAQIEQYEKNGTDAQQWQLEETEDGYYILISKVSGMALTVSGNEGQNGTLIQQRALKGSDIQLWRFELCPDEPSQKVVIYSDANYGGKSQELEPGSYDVDELTIGNDRLSSLRVPPKTRVILYEDAGFTGKSKEFISNADYVGHDFNDKTSSLKVLSV
ncbi:hypothetical protein NIES4071_05370 [Calothrix sp. NIES-4071]|nr:hypothetical protein NIES4071_05370 [Calothrix sp. NIES-4071]BAZ54882.1 hypothetical protein NIES4105_05360 [Calothrix sp. NIES-4105]